MSKRNVFLAATALVLALTVMAFAALPATSAPAADAPAAVELQIAALYAPAQYDQDFNPPYCPIPDSPGCSDGGG